MTTPPGPGAGNEPPRTPDLPSVDFPTGDFRAESFPNIVLIGARASGKSRAARRVAARIGWRRISTDDGLTARLGPIHEFVARHGWERFRDEETAALASIRGAGLVVDCGGGIVERAANFPLLRGLGTVYWVRAPLAYLEARLARPKHRARRPPLLPGSGDPEAEAAAVLERRTPRYREAAEADLWSVEALDQTRPGEAADRLLAAHFGPRLAVIAGGGPEESPGAAIEAAFRGAGPLDQIELRWDLFRPGGPERLAAVLRELPRERRARLIVTVRSAAEGGAFQGGSEELAQLLLTAARCGAGTVDLEAAADRQRGGALSRLLREAAPGVRLLGSFHDIDGCPADPDAVAGAMDAMDGGAGPAVRKLAMRARTAPEVGRVARWVRQASRRAPVVGVALGEAGQALRVVGGALGSAFGSFAPPPGGAAVAPGQLDAEEVRSRHLRWGRKLLAPVPVHGVIGHPVGHSLSPPMHEAAFRSTGIEACYQAFDVPPSELEAFLMAARLMGAAGLNVTIPHKSAVPPLLDRLRDDARSIGAANTIVSVDGALEGRNTDWLGVIRALREAIPHGRLRKRRASVFGAGGAARAVLYALLDEGAAPVVTSRSDRKASRLASEFGVEHAPWSDRARLGGDLLVNATPIGMRGAAAGGAETQAAPDAAIAGHALIFDLVYQPRRTRLLRRAEELGKKTVGGLSMLVFQAEAAFEAWTGERNTAETMRRAAETAEATRIGAPDGG